MSVTHGQRQWLGNGGPRAQRKEPVSGLGQEECGPSEDQASRERGQDCVRNDRGWGQDFSTIGRSKWVGLGASEKEAWGVGGWQCMGLTPRGRTVLEGVEGIPVSKGQDCEIDHSQDGPSWLTCTSSVSTASSGKFHMACKGGEE